MLCLVLLGLFSFFGTGVWRGALRDPWQTCGASDVIRRERFSRAMRWTSGVRVLLPQVVTCFCIDSRDLYYIC